MPRKPRWSVHLFLRSTPPTHHLSHGNYKPLFEKITWPKILLEKWFFYIVAHLKCWHIEENTNLVAFCPWDYWTLLQGDFLKILVIFWIFFLLIFLIFTHWLSSSLGQSAPWGKLAPAVWNKNLTRLKRAFIEYWRAIRLQEIKINVLLLNIEHCHLWKKRLRILATELRCVSSFRSENGSSPLMKIFSKASISLWNDIVL